MHTYCNKKKRGFTLLEIMMVVVIIGLLIAMAVPGFRKMKENSRASAIANDFRVFSDALHEYNILEGGWPHPNDNAGEFPAGMDGFLSHAWTNESPVGGNYFFEHPPGEDARLVIRSSNISARVIELVDRKLDDGDISSGQLRGNDSQIALTLL
ncbi:type II secretion system protein [Rubellicoccus peritrichatus]|uniref:Type II secretion system protein n=1 Tax=Rubellicoccus peritrichatus TaxID=3080537 RepID=A0AAQ3L8D4_9BACT|nr:type II secretion system protein [Puniceicoccus sp. CR14]WOO39547.1 type II secretion system protein [Puniceicoccus sp. CR14]